MELQKEWKLRHNFAEQSKLNVALAEAKKAAANKAEKLESTNITSSFS